MPILNQEIHNRCLSFLDAEGSDRYLWEQDTKPALKGAIETVVGLFNAAFAENKLTPENLRELVKIKVWQTNSFSRVSFDEAVVGHPLWSFLAVYPKIKTNQGASVSPSKNKAESKFRPELSFISSDKSAKRLNLEEWNQNVKNSFMPGNIILGGELTEYAYLDLGDFTSSTYVKAGDNLEITIRPNIPNELVAIAYLKYPTMPDLISGSIEFPQTLTDLITEITLNKISMKQGDGTNLWMTSSANINRLISLIK